MITVDLVGRLGNQMFQIAACVAHAHRVNTGYIIPKHSLNEQLWPNQFRHLANSEYQYKYSSITKVWREPSHSYTEIPPDLTEIKLHGYFQSEKYFKEYRYEIINLFGFQEVKNEINTCAIHIRLGDYLQMQDKHPIISIMYLETAIKYIIRNIGTVPKFLVFSDDITMAQEIIKEIDIKPLEFVFMKNESPLASMKSMASCQYTICSNSSFSWWASWMNDFGMKIVIMPRNWFGPGNSHLETKDIYPEGAIII